MSIFIIIWWDKKIILINKIHQTQPVYISRIARLNILIYIFLLIFIVLFLVSFNVFLFLIYLYI
jgi:hypothetical protein